MLRLPAAHPAALRFLRLAVPPLRCCFVSPIRPPRRPVGQGFGMPVAPFRLFIDVETTGSLRFLENPCVHALLVSDPGGIDYTRPISAHQYCLPFTQQRRLPQNAAFEAQSHGLHTRCLRFAAQVAPRPRKTRFRLLASFAGWDWLPTGFIRKVSILRDILLSQAFPDALSVLLDSERLTGRFFNGVTSYELRYQYSSGTTSLRRPRPLVSRCMFGSRPVPRAMTGTCHIS